MRGTSEDHHEVRHGGQPPIEAQVVSADARLPKAEQRCLQLIGLALRGRRAVLGSDVVLEKVRDGTAAIVFLAADAGANAEKKYRDKCAFYKIPLVRTFTRSELGRVCGRSNIVVVAVTDPGFAATILTCIGEFRGGEAFDETSGV